MSMKKSVKRVMETKREVKNARREYNLENGVNYSMVEFLHLVLNYPLEEAKEIRKSFH